ncbi:ABC transporter ATP-binding protein [Ferrovibrio sp.]|uniref:ABC transporter ATP-binding protein n=1 Tax=Ferrovibrio sp. TaxID=1917215 RepID=UPI00311D3045
MLELQDVTSSYGRIEVLHGVSLSVTQGEVVALVGSNGAGKTTLMRLISGIQPKKAGRLMFEGRDIGSMTSYARVSLGIAQVPEGRQVFAPLSVEDNLRLGAYLRRDAHRARDLDRIYSSFPILAERRKSPAGGLSGGQQQMLAMGRALMAKPRLLLLDEPSMGLAPLIAEQIWNFVRELKKERVTVLLVEQNAFSALSLADRAYVLETGHITLEGSGAELLQDSRVRAAYLGM